MAAKVILTKPKEAATETNLISIVIRRSDAERLHILLNLPILELYVNPKDLDIIKFINGQLSEELK